MLAGTIDAAVCNEVSMLDQARRALFASAVVLMATLTGCATAPPADDPDAVAEFKANNDPIEPTNRVIYAINDGVDVVVLRPIALLYRSVVPDPVQKGARNALNNLSSPVTLANDMMQGKPKRAGDTLMRFLINSTIGVGGIFDVADGWGWPDHDNDFGTTLALWGMSPGPYLYLPLFGPSNPRDTVGLAGNMALDPLTWIGGAAISDAKWARTSLSAVDTRSTLIDDLDKLKAQALDPYASIRSLSRQFRAKSIEDAAAAK